MKKIKCLSVLSLVGGLCGLIGVSNPINIEVNFVDVVDPVSSDNVIGYGLTKSYYNTNGNVASKFEVVSGTMKLDYSTINVEGFKIKSLYSNTFFVFLSIRAYTAPGKFAHQFESFYEDGWKMKTYLLDEDLTLDYRTRGMAFKDASPVDGFINKTITSSFTSGFQLGSTNSQGFKFSGDIELKKTYSSSFISEYSYGTQYNVSEPSFGSILNTNTGSRIKYDCAYNYNWDYETSWNCPVLDHMLIFEVDPSQILDDYDLGVNLYINAEMICDKDWFSGNIGTKKSFSYYLN